jgi:hypothetical protein
MYCRTVACILRLVLIVSTLLAATESGFAAKKPIPNKTTTDAAGRTHVRPAGRISEAQRKAAAQHRKAVRTNFMRSVKKNGGQK